jgi:hypothetical protein
MRLARKCLVVDKKALDSLALKLPHIAPNHLRQRPPTSDSYPPSSNRINSHDRDSLVQTPTFLEPARLLSGRFEDHCRSPLRMASFPADSGPSATPPVLPPKPGSHEASGISTPTPYGSATGPGSYNVTSSSDFATQGQQGGQDPNAAYPTKQQAPSIPQDPGEHWLPQVLEDKSYETLT